MRLRVRDLALVLIALLAASQAGAVRIGLFADPQAGNCNVTVPPMAAATAYLLAIMDDAPANGIKACEFQITGIPSGWFANFTPNGANFTIGNPLGGGALSAFSNCMTSGSRIVQLGTLTLFNVNNSPTHGVARVQVPIAPSNSNFLCPLIVLCDVGDKCVPQAPLPKYSKLCVDGLETQINGSGCTVDAEPLEPVSSLTIWPNPGLGRTSMLFAARRGGAARLVVYDLAGRRVRSLLSGNVTAGSRTLIWDGRDDSGHDVASGVYFVVFESPGSSSRTRLTLVR